MIDNEKIECLIIFNIYKNNLTQNTKCGIMFIICLIIHITISCYALKKSEGVITPIKLYSLIDRGKRGSVIVTICNIICVGGVRVRALQLLSNTSTVRCKTHNMVLYN